MSAWSLNKNQSIEYLQSQNRNASTDPDAAFHNPAGVAFLAGNGLYLGGGNQIVLQDRTITEPTDLLKAYGPQEYQGKIRVWLFPTVQAVYRMDDLSFFAHGGPLGGGGSGEFNQGLPKFDNMILGFANQISSGVKAMVDTNYQQKLAAASIPGQHVTTGSSQGFKYQRDLSFTGDEMTLGGTVGAAYKVLPNLSVSGAYRLSYARNAYKGTAKVSKLDVVFQGSQGMEMAGVSGSSVDDTLNFYANHVIDSLWKNVDVDVVSTGIAHSIVLGLDFKPNEVWNFGMRVEWNGQMEVENKTSTLVAPDGLLPYLAGYADGAKSKITEPLVVAGGVSWKPILDLTLESSWTYEFSKDVDHDGREANYHNSLIGGLGLRYKFTPRIETSFAYSYDWTIRNDLAREETNFDLPTHYLSTGLGFQAIPRLRIDGGIMLGIVPDGHGVSVASGAGQTMSSTHLGLGLGLQWSPRI